MDKQREPYITGTKEIYTQAKHNCSPRASGEQWWQRLLYSQSFTLNGHEKLFIKLGLFLLGH